MLKRVLSDNPDLCADGWGYTRESRCAFEESRAHLTGAHGIEEFERAVAFIERCCSPTKAITAYASSYGYKHAAEGWHRQARGDRGDVYISNGAFIAAALALGYMHRRIPGSPNCHFNFASLQRATRGR